MYSNATTKKKTKRMVTRVGFEPTRVSTLAPEASALDRSAILPDELWMNLVIDGFYSKKIDGDAPLLKDGWRCGVGAGRFVRSWG